MSRSRRDSQRSRMYKAESVIDGDPADHFLDIDECARYVRQVCRTKRWKQLCAEFGRKRTAAPKVVRARLGAAVCWVDEIRLPKWAWKKPVILHELAHALMRNGDCASHGREFAQAFIALVSRFMGQERARALRASFDEHGVKWRKTRKLTEAEKRAAAERLRAHQYQTKEA